MEKILELKEFLLEKKLYVLGLVVFILLLGGSCIFSYQMLNNNEEKEIVFLEEDNNEELEKETNQEICYVSVDIKGEVIVPGLYQVECDSRVQDVIDLAGGLTNNGDTSILNLGKKVTDEMVIIIYSKEEVKKFTNVKEEENIKIENCTNNVEIKNDACISNDSLIDVIPDNSNLNGNEEIGDTPVKVLVSINKATKEELMTLSGIGESKANNIISYRNENNGFKSLDEIKNVKGIGDSIFAKIKDSITL